MTRNHLFIFVILLAMLLAACGGGEETAGPTPQPEQGTSSAESSPEVGEEPPDEPQPAEAPPPTEEPQPTPEAEPTEATEATAESEPTEEPDEAAPASGEGWGESGSTAQSACDHPYFPLRTGTTWTMAGEAGDPLTWEVVSVEGDMQSATADMVMRSAELEFHYSWQCSADGGLVSFDFGNQGLSSLGPEVTIEVSEGTGMFLPAVDELVPGYSWDSSSHSTYTMVQTDGDLEMEIGGEMDTMQTSTVLSAEPVTFNNQTVPGLLVQQDSEVTMVMSIMDSEIENVISMGGEMELGRGLGMLRQTSFTDFGDFTMEATEIYVP